MLWKVVYSGNYAYTDFFMASTYDEAIAKAAILSGSSYGLELVKI